MGKPVFLKVIFLRFTILRIWFKERRHMSIWFIEQKQQFRPNISLIPAWQRQSPSTCTRARQSAESAAGCCSAWCRGARSSACAARSCPWWCAWAREETRSAAGRKCSPAARWCLTSCPRCSTPWRAAWASICGRSARPCQLVWPRSRGWSWAAGPARATAGCWSETWLRHWSTSRPRSCRSRGKWPCRQERWRRRR